MADLQEDDMKTTQKTIEPASNTLVACNKAGRHCDCCDHRGLHEKTLDCRKRICDGVTECIKTDTPFNVAPGIDPSGC